MALSRFIAACRLKFFRAKQRSMLARLPAAGSGIGMNSPITGGSEVAAGAAQRLCPAWCGKQVPRCIACNFFSGLAVVPSVMPAVTAGSISGQAIAEHPLG
jgi:hypothetical protein